MSGSSGRAVRLLLMLVGAVGVVLLLGACGRGSSFGPDTGAAGEGASAPVLPSAQYAAEVGPDAQAARLAELERVVAALRADTTGGWQARQDDRTGYARDLSGGRFDSTGSPAQVAESFVSRYGSAFGPAPTMVYDPVDYDATGVATVRATQVVAQVPVDGGELVIPVTRRGDGGEISMVRGRLFDVSGVDTTPQLDAAAAVRTVRLSAGAEPSGPPRLVVYPGTTPARLAWDVTILDAPGAPRGTGIGLGAGPSTVFVDAVTGTVLGTRPLATSPELTGTAASPAADLGKYDFTLPPGGTPITVRGTLPDGRTVSVNAERLPDGSVVMVDATGPGANRRTKKGIIAVFDGSRLDGRTSDLGPVLRFRNGRVDNLDAVMAMWSARQVLDYYRTELGRASFDGRNSPLLAVINYTQGDPCQDNAFFATAPGQSRMMIGVPCPAPGGKPSVRTFADLYIVGHEVTHGVTHTNALDFAGPNRVQQGAIDEGTSDYFGVVIENRALGRVGTTGTYFACYQLSAPPFCAEQTGGQHGLRDINSGATFDDFAFTLVDPFGLATAIGDDGHLNSLVWTNALWKARQRLAALDGGDPNQSARARAFDRAVHRATTTYLGPDSDLVDAAEAVQRAVGEVPGLGAGEAAAVRDQFRASKLCRGCTLPSTLPSLVASSSRVKTRPQVVGDRVAYTQFDGSLQARTMLGAPGSTGQRAVGTGSALALRTGAAGDWVAETVVTFARNGAEQDSVVLRNVRSDTSATLSTSADPTVGPAVSAAGVAWADYSGGRGVVRYRALGGGKVSSLPLPQPIAHLATDGGLVAVQQEDGTLFVWDVRGGSRQNLPPVDWARAPGILVPGGGLAMSGRSVAVLDQPLGAGRVLVYDLDARTVTTVTERAAPFGLSMDDGLVVWSEVTGPLPGRVNQLGGGGFVDTELRAYSVTSGTGYEVVDPRGQQGFPDVDGTLLTWQDTAGGGNDIVALTIPAQR